MRGLLALAAFQAASGAILWNSEVAGARQQAALLTHVAAGLAALALLGPFLRSHLARVLPLPRPFQKASGLCAALLSSAALATGTALAAQAVAGWSAHPGVATAHRWTGAGAGCLLAVHLWGAARSPAGRKALAGAGLALALPAAVWGLLGLAIAGSAARIEPSRRADPVGARLSGSGEFFAVAPPTSASCGVKGCHDALYEQWLQSGHGQADRDPYFRALEDRLAAGPDRERASRCSECHDPGLLLTGPPRPGAQVAHTGEAVSCYLCHAMREAGNDGHRPYVVTPPTASLQGDTALGRFLIRAWPAGHRRAYARTLYPRSRLCSACHLQTVSETIAGFGLLWIDNPYRRWELSRVSPLCQDCHMPALAGPDGSNARSHRFAGSNLMPGASPEHRRAVERLLAGEQELPATDGRPGSGPLFALAAAPPRLQGHRVAIALSVASLNRIGHQFPAGAQDLSRVWLEAEWSDAHGKLLGRWGEVTPGGPLLPGTPVFRRPVAGSQAPDRASTLALLRPGEGCTVELIAELAPSAVPPAATRLRASLCYRQLHAEALSRLAFSRDGQAALPLPPAHVLGRLDAALQAP